MRWPRPSRSAGPAAEAARRSSWSPAIRCATSCWQQQGAPYPRFRAAFNLLVFGGSQGAQFFAEFMPKVFARHECRGIARASALTQQVPAGEHGGSVKALCKDWDSTAELNALLHGHAGAHCSDRIWWSAAPAPRPLPNWASSAGPPSWCRCRMPSTMTSCAMPKASPAAGAGWVQPQATLEAGGLCRNF